MLRSWERRLDKIEAKIKAGATTRFDFFDGFDEACNSCDQNLVEVMAEFGVEEFSDEIKVPVEQILNALKSTDYKVKDVQQTLGEIAKENDTSPDKLYEAIKSEGVEPSVPYTIEGTGMGRKTLDTICSEKGLPIDDVLARLKSKGIEASSKDKLKDMAGKLGKAPMEIFTIIEGKD